MPVYFICISLTTSEVEHLFMHLKTICISFYVSSLFKALAYLFFPFFSLWACLDLSSQFSEVPYILAFDL